MSIQYLQTVGTVWRSRSYPDAIFSGGLHHERRNRVSKSQYQ